MLVGVEPVATTSGINTEKERIPMFWGFGHGLWLLLPLLLLGKFFWIILLVLLAVSLVRLFGSRNRRMFPYYHPGVPPVQPSALEILNQRYARGEIDAATYEQMRERLEASSGQGRQ
jgi:putative membrane protein